MGCMGCVQLRIPAAIGPQLSSVRVIVFSSLACAPRSCLTMQDWHQQQHDLQRRRQEQALRARAKMQGRGLAQVSAWRPLLSPAL